MGRRILVLLLVAGLLTGCWSRVEINDLGVVLGIGVDVGEEQAVRLTFYFALSGRPAGRGAQVGGEPVWVVSREADNLSDAIRQISLASARRISLHHLRVVLIGEEYARKGIADLLDFLGRNEQVRYTLRPLVVRGRAQEALETLPQLKGLQPTNIVGIMEAKGGVNWRLKEFLIARISDTHSGWMFAVEVIRRPAGIPDAPPTAVSLRGAGLFYGDQLIRFLDASEAQTLSWLMGNPRESIISTPCPEDPNKTLSAAVLKGGTQIRPVLRGRTFSFDVLASAQVNLVRLECPEAVATTGDRQLLEERLAADLKRRLERVIAVFQATQTDPPGFGKRLQLAYPDYFRSIRKRYPQLWPEAEVRIATEVTIRQSGLLGGPVNKRRGEVPQVQ